MGGMHAAQHMDSRRAQEVFSMFFGGSLLFDTPHAHAAFATSARLGGLVSRVVFGTSLVWGPCSAKRGAKSRRMRDGRCAGEDPFGGFGGGGMGSPMGGGLGGQQGMRMQQGQGGPEIDMRDIFTHMGMQMPPGAGSLSRHTQSPALLESFWEKNDRGASSSSSSLSLSLWY